MHGTCIGVGISVLPYETCSVCYVGAELEGPYGAGHAAKEQLVPPGQLRGDGLAAVRLLHRPSP